MMQNFGLEDLSHVPSRRNLLKYLVRVEMASDWFTRIYRSILAEEINILKSRYGVQTRLRALLEPATICFKKFFFFVIIITDIADVWSAVIDVWIKIAKDVTRLRRFLIYCPYLAGDNFKDEHWIPQSSWLVCRLTFLRLETVQNQQLETSAELTNFTKPGRRNQFVAFFSNFRILSILPILRYSKPRFGKVCKNNHSCKWLIFPSVRRQRS